MHAFVSVLCHSIVLDLPSTYMDMYSKLLAARDNHEKFTI